MPKNEKYDAACENDGRIVYVCDECGEEAVHRVLKLGHSWALRNMDREGAMWSYDCYCTRCSKTLKSVTDISPTIREVSATCDKDAYTSYTDIVIDDSGTILFDGDRPLEVKVVKQGTALGHHNKELDMVVRSGEVFDMRLERNSAAFMALGDLTCGTSDAKNPIDGFYKCDRCETNIPVKLYKSHVGMVTPVKRETCVEEGLYMIDKCDECCMKCTFSVPALGHDVVYETNLDKRTVLIYCEREGCEYGKTNSVTITLPAFDDVLYDKYGRVRIDEDVARESGYEVTEVVPGTCECSGVYTFVVDDSTTIRLLESELGNEAKYFIENGLKISFEIEKRASHQVGSELLCWVADGYRYYGRQCTVCGMVAVIRCEPID